MERPPRGLLDPLNQGVAIMAWLVDHPRHGVRLQFQTGAAREHVHHVVRLREFWIQPGIFQRSGQNDGHPVVKLRHEGIRFGRDNGERIEVVAVGRLLDIVEASKGNILVILRVNIVRHFVPALALPFIIATGGD
jgi:hypothetical protein